jgi:translation initiation factor 5B
MQQIKNQHRAEAADDAVFPVVLEILPNCIFHVRDPIVLGCVVKDGILKIGTPLVIPTKGVRDRINILPSVRCLFGSSHCFFQHHHLVHADD